MSNFSHVSPSSNTVRTMYINNEIILTLLRYFLSWSMELNNEKNYKKEGTHYKLDVIIRFENFSTSLRDGTLEEGASTDT